MNVVKRLIAVLLSVLLMFGSFSLYSFADDTEAEGKTETQNEFLTAVSSLIEQYDNNSFGFSSSDVPETSRIIVKTKTNTPLVDDRGALSKVEGWHNIHILQYANDSKATEALNFYKEQDFVEFAEMDTYVTVESIDTATDVTELVNEGANLSWGTSAVHIDTMNEMIANNGLIAEDTDITVAIFDSGLDAHGIIDPNRVKNGYNLFEYNTDTSDGDDWGHGTHVAGIIVQNTLSDISIRPYKVNTKFSQDIMTIYSILGTAIMCAVDNGDDVINISMSWGYASEYVDNAIDYAYDNDVPIVVAAGNDLYGEGQNANGVYPASNSKVITVASVDEDLEVMLKSKCGNGSTNYGTCIDIAAPGCEIVSSGKYYMLFSACGTSMATPFVTSAVAMIKSVYPDIPCAAVTDILKANAYVPQGWNTSKYGTGILDCTDLISVSKTAKPTIAFTDDGDVQLKHSSKTAKIYYTTDKSEPVIGKSPVYEEPISTNNVNTIKAVAYEKGKLPSDVLVFDVKWSKNIDMYYRHSVTFDELNIPPNAKIIYTYSSDEDIVTVDRTERKIYATGVGEAKVHIYLEHNRKVTVNVEAEYNFFQWILIVWFWGFLWYI
ncbi:MAG: S8 family serine peptidase [Acutalibacteraceae bacterium]|nr:S8 family serine peptidase [Acutalibacteraceae bacterium]